MDDWAAERGAVWLEPYVDARTKRRGRCPVGHPMAPMWNGLQQGQGGCQLCAHQQIANRLRAEHSDMVLELTELPFWRAGHRFYPLEEYRAMGAPWSGLCDRGHHCSPRMANLRLGAGPCRTCAFERCWDSFYVVRDPSARIVKFGITSTSSRRLAVHRRAGFREVLRLLESQSPLSLERHVKAILLKAGFSPVRGREYFRDESLPLILFASDQSPW